MNLGNRYSQHSFAQIPQANMARSKFDRSFAVKTTFDFDDLVPVFVDEMLPGDTVNLNLKTFARLATQKVPVMDNMYLDFFFFFVPNRLVWNNWEKFNGAQTDPGDSIDFLIPQLSITDSAVTGPMSIYDQMGLPIDKEYSVNALPFRAYNLIWNEWFRDQNLQDSLQVNKGDGPDGAGTYGIRKRAKKHDYFTSCLKQPQKGAAVTLPLGSTAPIISDGDPIAVQNSDGSSGVRNLTSEAAGSAVAYEGGAFGSVQQLYYADQGLVVDLTAATAASINALRQAFMIQSLLELDARGGTRYTEILRAHFNVVSPDFRLQRPEFLSSGTIRLQQHPVAQTSETPVSGTPQANLAAFSTAAELGNRIGFSKSFVEHGYVLGLVQARADITYQEGLGRMWTRQTRYDFFWPKLQELGEQAVLTKEIYYSDDPVVDDVVFGYQERYAEYRYKPSEIRGQFRSQAAQSLDRWHLAEEIPASPFLDSDFIESSTPIERSLAVTNQPHILIDIWYQYMHARPMMTYGVPATLGRF